MPSSVKADSKLDESYEVEKIYWVESIFSAVKNLIWLGKNLKLKKKIALTKFVGLQK